MSSRDLRRWSVDIALTAWRTLSANIAAGSARIGRVEGDRASGFCRAREHSRRAPVAGALRLLKSLHAMAASDEGFVNLLRVVKAPPQEDAEIRILTLELYADGLIVRHVLSSGIAIAGDCRRGVDQPNRPNVPHSPGRSRGPNTAWWEETAEADGQSTDDVQASGARRGTVARGADKGRLRTLRAADLEPLKLASDPLSKLLDPLRVVLPST